MASEKCLKLVFQTPIHCQKASYRPFKGFKSLKIPVKGLQPASEKAKTNDSKMFKGALLHAFKRF